MITIKYQQWKYLQEIVTYFESPRIKVIIIYNNDSEISFS
jgi:hypothetical protein